MEIYTERLLRNTNIRFKPPSDAEIIDGIKSRPVRIVEIDKEKINKCNKICDYQNRRGNQKHYEYIKIKKRKCFTNKELSCSDL